MHIVARFALESNVEHFLQKIWNFSVLWVWHESVQSPSDTSWFFLIPVTTLKQNTLKMLRIKSFQDEMINKK